MRDRQALDNSRMSLTSALRALHARCAERVVVSTMSAAREWSRLGDGPLHLQYLPSAMGQAPLVGLGLALARPQREVVVLNGDGCLLMNLGALVTIAASGAIHYTLVVVENGVYEVTGGQPTAAAAAATDFAALARAAGIRSVEEYGDAAAWEEDLPRVLTLPGPRCIVLHVLPQREDYELPPTQPWPERWRAFQAALG